MVRLGEALAVDVLAADDAGQEVRALFLAAVHDHRGTDQGLAHAADHSRDPGRVELLVQHRDPHRVQALAAELGRPLRTDQPGVGQRALPLRVGGMPQGFGQLRRPVTAGNRRHPPVNEAGQRGRRVLGDPVPQLVAELLDLRAEVKIHGRPP